MQRQQQASTSDKLLFMKANRFNKYDNGLDKILQIMPNYPFDLSFRSSYETTSTLSCHAH